MVANLAKRHLLEGCKLDHRSMHWERTRNVSDATAVTESTSGLKVDRAYQHLKRMIVTLELDPGANIDERELMNRLDIGRTPLREAVARLVSERLILHTPRKGAWVSPLSITDLQQMLEARAALDAVIARQAALFMTHDDHAALQAFIDEAAKSPFDLEHNVELIELDFAFHSRIGKIAGNTYLASFSDQVNSTMLRYWHLAGRSDQALATWSGRHTELIEALASGDPDWAEAAARKHVAHLRDNLRNVLV
jgi:DNA-binding GntR family transcriptional regulator